MANKSDDDLRRPDRPEMARTASPQTSSLLVRKLPIEVRRMVYQEAWRSYGLVQHIIQSETTSKLIHSPCKDAPNGTTDEQLQKADTLEEAVEILRRSKSSWALHWACEDVFRARQDGQEACWAPFLPILLTCKLFYLEAIDSIYQDITFCMTNTMVANDFLGRYPASTFRSISLCVPLPPLITDLYLREGDNAVYVAGGGQPITAEENPWERLLQSLSRMSNLRELDLWATTQNNIRKWHECVWEKKTFARLFEVKAPRKFVVNLPSLPDRPPKEGREDWYLDHDDATAPFTLVRSDRPNSFRVHMFLRGIYRARGHWPVAAPPQQIMERVSQWHERRTVVDASVI